METKLLWLKWEEDDKEPGGWRGGDKDHCPPTPDPGIAFLSIPPCWTLQNVQGTPEFLGTPFGNHLVFSFSFIHASSKERLSELLSSRELRGAERHTQTCGTVSTVNEVETVSKRLDQSFVGELLGHVIK